MNIILIIEGGHSLLKEILPILLASENYNGEYKFYSYCAVVPELN
jgi:hypothetical protein